MEKPGKWEWLEDANCASVGPVFDTTHETPQSEVAYLKRVCQECRVGKQCLALALQFDDNVVAGGMTRAERKQLKRETRDEQ